VTYTAYQLTDILGFLLTLFSKILNAGVKHLFFL